MPKYIYNDRSLYNVDMMKCSQTPPEMNGLKSRLNCQNAL